jgi:hypothetical protein
VARVIQFDPKFNTGDHNWERFPRFEEVDGHVDAQAHKLFDAEASLARNRELYARVESRLAADDRPLLRDLYAAITAHQEKFERAAYLVGLRAATGKLEGLPPLKDDRRDGPEPA